MKIYNHIKSILEVNEKYCKDGKLFKNVLVEAALNIDEDKVKGKELLSILLSDPTARKHFFIEVDEVLVFDKVKFQKFVSNKEFLPDSYTAFKNKIGLTANGKYLTAANEVVLDFPYKDCVLEGGQTKDDQKRKEIFWNETLAPDEIDRLFEPKVFTNWKRYDKDGETHELINNNISPPSSLEEDNFIIKGNNLLALHSLKKVYKEKIKLIYIDPPYNTKGNSNTFIYNNTFNHSTWLTFMKNRLEIARELLRKDGFIAITIDHEELLYLGVLVDEVFERNNRIGIVTIVHKPEGRNQEKFFGTSNEFMLVYAKNKNNANFQKVILDAKQKEKFNLEDKKGRYRLKNFIRLTDGKYSLKENKPSHYYPIYVSDDLKSFSLEEKDNCTKIYPITENGTERTWKTKGKTFLILVDNDSIVAKKEAEKIVLYEKLREDQVIKTHWTKKDYHAYHFGTKLLEQILGRKAFSFPKSVYAVLDTLKIMTREDDIILDFFAGSGTTAHAVLELNKQDGGNRKFILVEQMDYVNTVTCPRVQKVMQKENINSSFIYTELAKENDKYIDMIKEAANDTNNNNNDSKTLIAIWEKMKNEAFITYKMNINDFDSNISSFEKLSLDDQKEVLMSLLDKNHLYISLHEMQDEEHKISERDKNINKEFYGL